MRTRTGYSFRTAFGHLNEVMAQLDTDFAPITDRASTFGWTKWAKLCKKSGKRPVYGVELAVTDSPGAKKLTKSYFTFIATDDLTPINELVALASSQFRYEPLLTYDQLANVPESVAILIGRNALVDKIPLGDMISRPTYYMPMHPSTPKMLLDWALANGIEPIAAQDNVYPAPDDRGAYEVLCGRTASSNTWPQYILSADELRERCGDLAFENLLKLAERCTATLETAQLIEPNRGEGLRAMCLEGAKRVQCDLSDPVYAERLDRELDLIAQKDFADYFYIIADLIAYAKTKMFVGPARGSSCGSLVCYLLGITTIDPIPFGLVFERFIDITRKDLPDIDIDFSDQRRHLAFEYLESKYGRDRVARLGTVALYKPKSAINETAAALNVPKWKTQAFTDSILERSSGDARALQAIEDTFNDTETGRKLLSEYPELLTAKRLEGHPRHHSQHAAGVVVTRQPVNRIVAIDARTGATHCDKKDAEELNLLKIDALGLTQLSVFEDCLEMIGKDVDWLLSRPIDDPKAFDILNQGRWAGIFQWNGDSLQSITNQITVTEFEDLVSITALSRPGPTQSGGTNQWIARKNGKEAVVYPHEAFEQYLETSLGVVVYQEQVMQIGREIGQLTWDDVTELRKAMSKSLGKEYFDKFGDRFKKGAARLGMEPARLDRLWDDMCAYGSWAFNRSHSVAYAYISYWCCYLKAYHPVEFAAAALSHEDDPDKQLRLLREIVKEGVSYVPVDAILSTDKWQAAGGRLIGPLSNVIGFGPKKMAEVLHSRATGVPISPALQKFLATPRTKIDDLTPLDSRIKELLPEGLPSINVLTKPTPLEQCQTGVGAEVVVIARLTDINPRDHNEVGSVVKRGYTMTGQTKYLNLVIEDDTDRMLARINRRNFFPNGAAIVERGGAGDVIYALRGRISPDYRVLDINMVRFIGTMKKEKPNG